MNYLAHIFLSGNDTDIQIGNFIGDAIKGKDYQKYPVCILKGILLHRQIDSFTDIHTIVHRSKKRLHSRYGHYAGVIIDILYDHFLTVNWNLYSEELLPVFIAKFYGILQNNKVILPQEIQKIIPKLIANNWFDQYKSVEGIARVLIGMEKYIIHDIPLHLGVEDLKENYELLEKDFLEFFPLLHEHSKNILQTLDLQYEKCN